MRTTASILPCCCICAAIGGTTVAAPAPLERITIASDGIYWMATDQEERVLMRTGREDGALARVESRDVDTLRLLQRGAGVLPWSIGGDCVFSVNKWGNVPQPLAPIIVRACFGNDSEDHGQHASKDLLEPISYEAAKPVQAVIDGVRGWRRGDSLTGSATSYIARTGRVTDVPYDIRAISASELELWLSLDQKLMRWGYDGKEWRLRDIYDVAVDGPFVVGEGGCVITQTPESVVAISGFDTNVRREEICPLNRESNLTVVINKVQGETYVAHEDCFTGSRGM